MYKLKNIVSNNLIYLRRKKNLTQIELSEKINYSDNAISRWERGEVTPSLETLEILCKFYNISINDMLDEHLSSNKDNEDSAIRINRVLTILFSISLVWFITIIAYIYVDMFLHKNLWVMFVIGLPLSCAVALFYNKKWGNRKLSLILSSILIWTTLASVYLCLIKYNLWLIFILGIPSQLGILSWYFMKPIKKIINIKIDN